MDSSLPMGLLRWLQQLWTRVSRVQMTESGPYITQGEGVPTAALPSGSIYLRTDGGAGTTLYVREGAAWTAK
jgi:hypothetical protein